MKNTIFVILFLLLSFGCSGRDPINNNDEIPVSSATEAKIQTLIKAEAQARQERDAAIKTSQDAKAAAFEERQKRDAALELAGKYDSEAKRLDKVAKELKAQEIAGKISFYSWLTFGAGALAFGIGLFLLVRFGGKTALTLTISGASTAVLGLIGVWIAPWWATIALIGAIILVSGLVLGLVYLLFKNHDALFQTVQKIQDIKSEKPELKEYINKTLGDAHSISAKSIISKIKTKLG
jgi:hypothetical protein